MGKFGDTIQPRRNNSVTNTMVAIRFPS